MDRSENFGMLEGLTQLDTSNIRSVEMYILPATFNLVPDASFFKGCGAVLTITRSVLYQPYIGDHGSIAEHSYMRRSDTRLAFA